MVSRTDSLSYIVPADLHDHYDDHHHGDDDDDHDGDNDNDHDDHNDDDNVSLISKTVGALEGLARI